MAYVIGSACIDCVHRMCIEECPVDCIYVGDRKAYINPHECIDCGACEVVCPETAIAHERYSGSDPTRAPHIADAFRFFEQPLPGRLEPLGEYPGGAEQFGDIGVDTELVASFPRKEVTSE